MKVLAVLLSVAACVGAIGQRAVFQDEEFRLADWSLVAFEFGVGAVAIASQEPTGGNPGAFRRVHAIVQDPGRFDTSGIVAFSLRPSFRWDPAVDGPLASIRFRIDSRMFQDPVPPNTQALFSVALRQDGKYYIGLPQPDFYRGTPSWLTYGVHCFGRTDFCEVDLSNRTFAYLVESNPDFSENGDEIVLGFVAMDEFKFMTGGNGPQVTDFDFDNVYFELEPTFIPAEAYVLEIGSLVGGSLSSLETVDDNALVIQRGTPPLASDPPLRARFEQRAPCKPGEVRLSVTSKGSIFGLTQQLECFDWVAGAWAEVDARALSTSYATTIVLLESRFIGSAKEVRLRVSCRSASLGGPAWTVSFDRIGLMWEP